MNKVSKKERNQSGKKCNNVKKGAPVKNCSTTATTDDLSQTFEKLNVQPKPLNGIVNGEPNHRETPARTAAVAADTVDTKETDSKSRPSKGRSKNRRNGAKKNANQAVVDVTPSIDIDTNVACASTSVDISVSPKKDCLCTLTNHDSSPNFNDTDFGDDFDFNAYIKARVEQSRAQLSRSSHLSSINEKASEKASTSHAHLDSTTKGSGEPSIGDGSVKLEEKEEEVDIVKDPVIVYVGYESELQMPLIMKIIQKDLSEPYSIYTYRYFIHNWPNLCFLAMCADLCVGAIVCKLDLHRLVIKRGYIAMLAVDGRYRKHGIGSTLVRRAIAGMVDGGADEVVLETEITNRPALRLYEALGFVRDKRLFRYYLNGVDALRLKLWLR